jgi:hypothetical protein
MYGTNAGGTISSEMADPSHIYASTGIEQGGSVTLMHGGGKAEIPRAPKTLVLFRSRLYGKRLYGTATIWPWIGFSVWDYRTSPGGPWIRTAQTEIMFLMAQ